MADPNVKFIRIKGRVVPIRKKEGRFSKARRKSQRRLKGKFTDPGPNQQPRPYKSRNTARKIGRGFKRGGKLAIGYGGLVAAGYGTKKAWDNSSGAGKGAMIGGGLSAASTGYNLRKISKNPAQRAAVNAILSRKGGKIGFALGSAATIGTYAGLGAIIGKQFEK